MQHFIRLAALAMALAPAVAVAQVQTYYHAGAWDAFSGRTDKGTAVCGIGSTLPPDDRRLSVSFQIGGTDTDFSASKPGWAIPANTHVTVVMQIGLNTPWTEQGTGDGHSIDWVLTPDVMGAFDHQFRDASLMTLTFPDGNEPPWTISLAGSTAISNTIERCVRDLTREVQAAPPAQPVTNGTPAAAESTQPFTAPSPGPAAPH